MTAAVKALLAPRAIAPPPPWLLPAAAVTLAAFLVLLLGPALFGCGDTSWHLAAGDWVLAHGAVPRADPFSFTFAGRPWVAHEWLAEGVMAATFAAGGWALLACLFAAALAALLLTLGATLGRHLPPRAVLVILALVTATLAPAALARPHVLGWLLLATWLAILLRARDARRAPPPAAALLMLVWANLHASFLFGLVLAAALGLEAFLSVSHCHLRAGGNPFRLTSRLHGPAERMATRLRGDDEVHGWLAFAALALAAALATPHGLHGLLFPIQLSAMTTLPLIGEWRPTDFADQPAFALLLAAGLYTLATRRPRVPPLRVLIVLATLAMALAHARHQAIFAIVAPLLIAPALGHRPAGSAKWPPLVALLACAALAVTLRLAYPAAERETATNPVAALDALPPALRHARVLNDYAFGGPLIRRGIPVFIDGRADMYGDAFMARYDRIQSGDRAAVRDALERYRIAWTIFPPATPIVAMLDHEPGWRRLRSDEWAVVHVRVG